MSGLWQINRWSLKKCPDLRGKSAVVTGGARSIGAEITRQLLIAGCSEIAVLSKNPASFDHARRNEWRSLDTSGVTFYQVDLGSMSEVEKVAKKLRADLKKIDMLYLNAGLPTVPEYRLSPDGIDEIFAVNHLGHFLLTSQLLPLIEKTASASSDARVVVTSSSLHQMASSLHFETLESDRRTYYQPIDSVYRYARSKLANILFTHELNKKLQQRGVKGVYVNVFFPGNVATASMDTWKVIFGPLGYLMKAFFATVGQSTKDAATTALYLGCAPEIKSKDIHGRYFIPAAYEYGVSKTADDDRLAEQLWMWSERKIEQILSTSTSS